MELRTELKQRLRSARSWPGLIEELEREVEKLEPKELRAQKLFELGEICEELFLRKDRAMVHYQAAFKLSPQDARALERARRIYREMGNLDMVATLLGLELKVAQTPEQKSEIQGQLGIALLDLGRRDQALPNLEEAAEARADDHDIADALAAANYDKDDWLGEAERLTKQAEKSGSSLAARIYLRIARIYRLEVPTDPIYLETLNKVVQNEPQHDQANFLLEGALGALQKWDEIVALHDKRAYALADEKDQADLFRRFASVWALRFKDLERAAYFYRKALQAYYGDGAREGAAFPGHLAAFGFLREIEGPKGEWQKLLQLADLGLGEGGKSLSEDELAILATQAGVISWHEMKDTDRARGYFDRVQKINPENEELRAFLTAVPGGNGSQKTNGHAVEAAPPEAPSAQAEAVKTEAVKTEAVKTEAVKTAESAPVAQRAETIDDATRAAMEAAKAAEAGGPDKGIDAWKKLVQAHPTLRAVRRELRARAQDRRALERAHRAAEGRSREAPGRDARREGRAALRDGRRVPREAEARRDGAEHRTTPILALRPGDPVALDALATQYEHMKRWPDLIGVLQKKAASDQ